MSGVLYVVFEERMRLLDNSWGTPSISVQVFGGKSAHQDEENFARGNTVGGFLTTIAGKFRDANDLFRAYPDAEVPGECPVCKRGVFGKDFKCKRCGTYHAGRNGVKWLWVAPTA